MAAVCCAADGALYRLSDSLSPVVFPGKLAIPSEVLGIARRLEEAGFATWCVGGAVRDSLLGYRNKDFDLATAATPDEVRALFRRSIPIGIEHGTVGVLDRHKRPHEVTTFRRDVKTDGRHAQVEFGVSLRDDLARRDFTINAIAYHPFTHEWRDPFSGRDDMDAGIVRGVGDPQLRFREDYLRILRAIRFAARFHFAIEPATYAAAQSHVDGLHGLSAERVRDEWLKGLDTAREVSEFVALWDRIGGRAIWLPEIPAGAHDRLALDVLPTDPTLITAYLSRSPVDTLRRLRCSRSQIERGRLIHEFRDGRPSAADLPAVRRWLAKTGRQLAHDLLAIDAAEGSDAALSAVVDEILAGKPVLSVTGLAIDGNALSEIGVPRGPEMGKILALLLDEVLDDPEKNRPSYLTARVRALLSGARDARPDS